MAADLRREIRQQKPFASLAQEAHLNIQRTQAAIDDGLEQLLKAHGISGTQYNVLRILRGAGHDGLCRQEIADRLLTRMPDVTRLLDRMEEAGLVERERSTTDRRVVSTRLTKTGRSLVDSLDAPVMEEHQRVLGHLSATQLQTLIELLTLARG